MYHVRYFFLPNFGVAETPLLPQKTNGSEMESVKICSKTARSGESKRALNHETISTLPNSKNAARSLSITSQTSAAHLFPEVPEITTACWRCWVRMAKSSEVGGKGRKSLRRKSFRRRRREEVLRCSARYFGFARKPRLPSSYLHKRTVRTPLSSVAHERVHVQVTFSNLDQRLATRS
jgi:hypothetical protein